MLATPILTNISSKSQIFFAQSPIHFNLQNEAQNASIQKVTVEVYLWRGLQQADLPTTPTLVFNNIPKISPADNYIAIEISNEIRAFITSSNLNKNNPQWSYNTVGKATTSGEGVYFHIVYKVDAESDKQLGTYFSTNGYRYDFEQLGGNYTTYTDAETYRNYAFRINYDSATINLSTVIATGSTQTMITRTLLDVTGQRQVQTGVKCLIAYINRLGLWDVFTPFGKFVEEIPTKREEYSNSFRNPLAVNAQIQHLKQFGAPRGNRKFTINTGLLDERNNYQVLEIIQSPKVYIVTFSGETYTAPQIGITIDSTSVTIDDTDITIDSQTVTTDNLTFYSKFVQIPVKNATSNFLKKTQLNDKSSISYSLEFEATNNFINDIQ
jgi:hypothetical protein